MRTKRVEQERRMRVMARAKVEMLLGIYDWKDGRGALRTTGAPRVENAELLRVGGYSANYKFPQKTLFADPYFTKQVREEMSRRETKSGTLVAYDPARVERIRDLFFTELETKLRHEPQSFTTAQLIAGSEKFELLSRARAERLPPEKSPDMMQNFNAFISRTVNVMSESERERLVETSAEAAEERVETIKRLIDQANIVEADADDCDVIDAEIDPE